MLLPKSSRVCIPCFKSVATRIYRVKVSFLAFLGPDMETEMGVVIYMHLKHLLDFIDSKYIWVHGSIYLSSSVFTEIPFLVFLAFTQGKEKVWPGGTQPMFLSE